MIGLNELTEEEIKYLCDVIPSNEVQEYLKRNPQEFTKLRKGFRVIKAPQTSSFLFTFRNRLFISSFIEKHITRWLSEIKAHIEKCLDEGDTTIQAYLHTFPDCYFVNNLPLYFKLAEEEIDHDVLLFLSEAVSMLRENQDKQRANDVKTQQTRIVDEGKKRIKELETDYKRIKNDSEKKERKIAKLTKEKEDCLREKKETEKALRKSEKALAELKEHASSIKNRLAEIENKHKSLSSKCDSLKGERDELNRANKELQVKLEDAVKRFSETDYQIKACTDTFRPTQLDQFTEFLTYNFQDIGLDVNSIEVQLLIKYLIFVLFNGEPLIIQRISAHLLAKCISNCLIANRSVETLVWTEDITTKKLVSFLNTSGRVVCIDGFIGHFDEFVLFDILGQYKSKITFVSFDCERTLSYIPEEILSFGHYLNVSKFVSFQREYEITEDPSCFEEERFVTPNKEINKRIARILNQIMRELSFSEQVINKYISFMEDEENLGEVLLYTVLPYVVNVKKLNPFLGSDRLQKYAGFSGRSPYRDHIIRWFGDE